MADFVSREKRANIMRGSKAKDTRPELAVRRLLHGMGYRFRLHRKDLPGKPDIAFVGRKKAVFVHGCFWHQHLDPKCPISRKPSSNTEFWDQKFATNRARDERHEAALKDLGWDVLTIWECEIQQAKLGERLAAFIGPTRH
ncbi:very short patch repair endonuclease [Sphingomicrobium aestuariivivum]|uniref:very short patch repair endonuclease n=1 Tax=Sphingomicrobium aestuariivivum TaxID=1582356 RepID=UPI001FD71179|nr:very short patch repair endonuclease [Sphingomicrobium aestuariivivum]MCJ8190712.1 very short patch repair endonuclease [Sphingomicrobium aestuariivivum]